MENPFFFHTHTVHIPIFPLFFQCEQLPFFLIHHLWKTVPFLSFSLSSTAFHQSYPQYFTLLIEKKTALVYNVLRLGNSALQFQETENDR